MIVYIVTQAYASSVNSEALINASSHWVGLSWPEKPPQEVIWASILFLSDLSAKALYCKNSTSLLPTEATQISQANLAVNMSYNRACDFIASLSPSHWWTGSVIIRCMCEWLKPCPILFRHENKASTGTCIISGSNLLADCSLEWKGHYYLDGIGIDLKVPTFLSAKGKALRSQSPPPPPHVTTVPTPSRLPVTSCTLAPHDSCISQCCPVLGQSIIVVLSWGCILWMLKFVLYFPYTLQVWRKLATTACVPLVPYY